MHKIRLYGKGAKLIHLEKEVIRSEDGHIDVPPTLVATLEAEGWSQNKPELVDFLHSLAAPDVVALEAGEQIGGGKQLTSGEQ